jgi:hypothetical protein
MQIQDSGIGNKGSALAKDSHVLPKEGKMAHSGFFDSAFKHKEDEAINDEPIGEAWQNEASDEACRGSVIIWHISTELYRETGDEPQGEAQRILV